MSDRKRSNVNFAGFNRDEFYFDLHNIPFDMILRDTDEKVPFLNSALLVVFDLHAPIKTVRESK